MSDGIFDNVGDVIKDAHSWDDQLGRRREVGEQCVEIAGGRGAGRFEEMALEDRETYASDAISDILTAVLGPAGVISPGGALFYDDETYGRAQDLLAHALESYRGDAEDYTRPAEPGEYGYEEDN